MCASLYPAHMLCVLNLCIHTLIEQLATCVLHILIEQVATCVSYIRDYVDCSYVHIYKCMYKNCTESCNCSKDIDPSRHPTQD